MNTTGKKSTPGRMLWMILLTVMIGACGFSGEKKPCGDATPIPEGHSPVDVIRTIQNEFIQLKKPIKKIQIPQAVEEAPIRRLNLMSEMQDAYIYAAGMKIYNAYKSE